MLNPIKVKCKKCGRDTKSDEFVLDPVYKMMVCRECVKERKTAEFSVQKQKVQEAKKVEQEVVRKQQPAGWDHEDAEIERAYKEKAGQKVTAVPIDNEHIKYTCQKCKYSFKYNTVEQRPPRCSYCGTPVKY
jgi:hypothetical protein